MIGKPYKHKPYKHSRWSAVAGMLVAGLALAGAGPAAASGDGDGTVTIDHAFGETTVEVAPERIVSLSTQWTDVLLAMGVQPVGYFSDTLAGDDGLYPWEGTLDPDAAPLTVTDGLPLEQIAALQPDLIVVDWLAPEETDYAALAAIAPTIGLLGERQVDPWQEQVAVAGEVLGDPAGADAVVAGVDELVAATRGELPGLEGSTFALANYVPGDMINVVADPDDGASVLFEALGMELDPELLAVADGSSGRVELSLEQVSMLDADVLVIFSNDGDPRDLVGYDQLPAVTSGAVAELDYETVVGLNTPTPLSIPYSLDAIRPALEAAAS